MALRRRRLRALVALGLAVALLASACDGSNPDATPSTKYVTAPAGTPSQSAPLPSTSAPSSVAPPHHHRRTGSPGHAPPPAHPTLTAGGKWWGVDSSGPINEAALDNVHDWYRGAQPQMWGRYLNGTYAVTRAELAFARRHGIYVYVLIPDLNCSVCDGGSDICGNDNSAAQAHTDAQAALQAAKKLGIPHGAVLFKDIEQIGSCSSEPTATYLTSWYNSVKHSDYRVGFYGNSYRQYYNFPRAYCAAKAHDPAFAANVTLDDNEPEPQLGAPRNTIGPTNAPAFAPFTPHCAPRSASVIWQYGESIDNANYTDVDQATPNPAGLLAPNGGVS